MFANHHTTVDNMFSQVIRDCLDGGQCIVGQKDSSYDLTCYTAVLENPLARITTNRNRPLNLVTALARFTWLIAGNNRLEDIAYYEPKVMGYTDNGLTVPGSNYGARLMGSGRPGLNQVDAAIDRLQKDPNSRQAAAVVWTPEDATVRRSNDVPCEFGMFFNVRNDSLQMVNIMRSNNAFRLLPFNVFEFTMLGELVAASVGVPFGQYVHMANSMHVLNANAREWDATVSVGADPAGDSIVMRPMPEGSWQYAQDFAVFEAQLRHTKSTDELARIAIKANESLNPYWYGLFLILLAYTDARFGNPSWTRWLDPGFELHQWAESDIDRMIGQRPVPMEQAFAKSLKETPSGNPYANIGDES